MGKTGSGARQVAAALMLPALALNAHAGPLLRPADSPAPGSAAAAAAAARAARTSEMAARQANESLRRAADAMRRFQTQQAEARAAAAAAASSVPNGLTSGGLTIAPGARDTPNQWMGANLPTQSQNGQRTEVGITQTQPKAILTWETFNVGRETDVHFDQTAAGADAASWIALNRINDPSGRPSQILGSIRAEGQVYLINPNGIIFGGASQVNVNSLIASSLDFYGRTIEERNRRFLDGILYNPDERNRPALVFGEKLEANYDELHPAPDANHNPTEIFARGDGVTVEAGAQITAAGGRAMLLGHNVNNAGTIQATDGEVVIAAGSGIYLNKNYRRGVQTGGIDPDARGITVGVNRGGRVENTGVISSDRGSVNIQAKSILQAGLLQATTSATANGSINLTAGDGIFAQAGTVLRPYPDPLLTGAFGDLTFGQGSTTQILPDSQERRAIGFDQFKPSLVELFGRYITFERNATLFAPGANVKIDALRGLGIHDWVRDQASGALVESPDDARIYLAQGSRIDLSGLRGIEVAMERNTIQAELRANELRDNPLLRDSFIRGQKVYFDARRGTALADVSGYYDLIERDVAELMTEGGTLQLKAPQIITRAGSVIDLSGGSLRYLPGYVRSTRLVDDSGRVVSIEDADPNAEYVGFADDHLVHHAHWGVTQNFASPFRSSRGRYDPGYFEGRSAGTITIGQVDIHDFAPAAYGYRVLDGDVVADVLVGDNQRGAPAGATSKDVTRVWRERPRAATLNFGYLGVVSGPEKPLIGGNITIGQSPLLPDDFDARSRIDPSAQYNHVLPARYFDGHTFSTVNLISGTVGADGTSPGGRLTIGQGVTVDLGDYGRLNFTGTRADIDGTIRAPGGSVTINAARVAPRPRDPNDPEWTAEPDWRTLPDALKPQINLGSNALIDVAGRWVNELQNPAERTQLSINGGSVSLITSNRLDLAAGSVIDVSGGGRLSADGRKVTAGVAGSISLINAHSVIGARFVPVGPRDGEMNLAGELRGYGLKAGGSLTIATGRSVLISDRPAGDTGAWVLSPDIFREGGFSSFTVSGSSGVTVAENTLVAPKVGSFILDHSGQSIETGARLFGSTPLAVLGGDLAQPMSLTLSAPAVDAQGDLLRLSTGQWSPPLRENPGAVTVATGAEIRMAPRSTVRLVSGTTVFVDGTVCTPGGLIDLRVGVDRRSGNGAPPALRLGEHARLLAPAYVKTTFEGLFSRRSVEDGGRVNVSWFRFGDQTPGDIVGFVMTDPGSIIDVSGIHGPADLALVSPPLARPNDRYVERMVDGAAGSITIGSDLLTGLGGTLAGQLRLAPGGETGRGGSLEIGAPQLVVTQSVPAGLPHVTLPSPIDRQITGLTIYGDRLNDSGADDLALKATGTLPTSDPRALVFDGDVTLATRRSIQLGGPLIAARRGAAGKVSISSGYVSFNPRNSPTEPTIAPAPLATNLGGSFTVKADLIDIGYGVDFGCNSDRCRAAGVDMGFSDVRLASRGDIRLESQQSLGFVPGTARISTGGALTLEAAQVYVGSALTPRPLATDPGFLINAGSSVTVLGNGGEAPVPYSYGERLTIRAPEIVQAGVLRAPLGEIRLEGERSVTLAPGSLTSTSLEGVELVGNLASVTPDDPFPGLAPAGDLSALPNKSVQLTSPNITVRQGATVDVSGGGDVESWQFIRGNGGSRNILRDRGAFAVLPGYGDAPRPAGWQDRRDTDSFFATSLPRVGDRVYLAGVAGLPAGEYTLLPADYAMLPGGVLIRALGSGLAQLPASIPRPDGSSLIGGYRLVGGTPVRDSGYTRFLAMPRDVFSKYSAFATYSYNDFVAATAEVAGITARAGLDAGSVVLGATSTLVLDGSGRFGAAPGGLLGNLDISSQRIAIVGGGSTAPAGYLSIDAGTLSRFGAGSIFVGGRRSQGVGGTTVTVNATDVLVSNGPGSVLSAPEILLGARDSVTISAGSAISAEGQVLSNNSPLLISGDGALLRVSTGDRVAVKRTGAQGSAGILDMRAATALRSSRSLTLDGSRSVLLDSTAVFDAAQLDLSSVRVSIGDVPSSVGGTILSGATLDNLGRAQDLLIRGSESIDLYDNVRLGGRDASGLATLGTLTLDTGLLRGVGAGASPSVVAREIALRNSGTASQASTGGTGVLSLDAGKLVLGPGEIALGGFATVDARANVVQARGTGALDFAGSISVASDLVTAAAGSDYALRAGGNLSVARLGGPAQAADDFGGRLSLSAANVALDTRVDLPAGVFEAKATSGNLTLGGTALITLRGRTVDFRDVFKDAPGGMVRLSASGDVVAADGSRVDVSGDPRGGNAGSIEVAAGGRASLSGGIQGTASSGYRGGRFSLDAGNLSDFAQLNAALEAGRFNSSRAIHLANGDLALAAGQTLTAHDVLLRSDNGAVSIAGTIDASGNAAYVHGGRIQIIGGNGVSLAATARLDARAGATRPGDFAADSGSVEIEAAGGRLSVAAGALVDVSGGKQGGGKVLLRALREGDDLAIDRLDGRFVGARDTALAGVRTYQASTLDGVLRDAMLADAAAWAAHAPAIQARLGTDFEVRPGIQVHSAGDLAIAAEIDLSAARYGAGAPGYLDFSAAGDIQINSNISDGFASALRTAQLNSGRSWSYGFDAGRDVVLAAGTLVRTGTGDIRLHAGRDLVLTDNLSLLYTAGARTPIESGFAPIPGRITGEFPTQGGDIRLFAGRDIRAPVTGQSASAWLFRYGDTEWTGDLRTSTVAQQTSWSIVFENFEQGIGALGGGNIEISAARDISQIAASLPTTGHMTTPVGGVAQEEDVRIRGGGNLTLRAGRDLRGGVFLVGQGTAEVSAGGQLTVGETLVAQRDSIENPTTYTPRTLAAMFGLADAALTVNARSGAEIEAAFDPMLQGQICQNSGCDVAGHIIDGSAFFGMTERTAMRVGSASGDARYNNNPWASVDVSHGTAREAIMYVRESALPLTTTNAFARAPGTTVLVALRDDVVFAEKRGRARPLTLAPTNGGTFELLGRNAVRSEDSISNRAVQVTMLDVGADYRRGPRHAFSVQNDTRMMLRLDQPARATNSDRGFVAAHAEDPEPARLYSMSQSIALGSSIAAPKAVSVYAGKDLAGTYRSQNNRAGDVSSFVAERDTDLLSVSVTGIGDAVVEAGRHLKRTSVISAGDNASPSPTPNLALPSKQGANIYMYAGARDTDYDGFAAAYLDPENSARVVRTYLPELAAYLRRLGYPDQGEADLIARFNALPLQSRKAFVLQMFFTELKQTGVDVTDPASPRYQNYSRGYAAIQRLFPRDSSRQSERERSNVLLNAVPVETQAGGDITILAPYGRVEIGGPAVTRPPESGGVVTRKGGAIRIMADQNIDLFSSRVFTLLGGDITMWSSNGDITAGIGAKTTIFRPPLTYTIDNDGRVALNVFGLQTGAGIGVLDAGGTGVRERSRLDLIAPRGEVNAGDAGIRVAGDINIAALRVVGFDNIQFSGTSTGVPKVVVPNVAAITEADKTLAAATEKVGPAAQAKAKPEELPSIVTVEVIGYEVPRGSEPAGGERFTPADRERNGPPVAPGEKEQRRRRR